MKLLDTVKNGDIIKLCPYVQELFKKLIPIIESIDESKISEESKIEIIASKKDYSLNIWIEPGDKNIPGINLYASKSQCILGMAGSEQIECHSCPEAEATYLIKNIIQNISDYLNGITIIENYNNKGRLISKTYLYGIDRENDRRKRIGLLKYLFTLFPKMGLTKKITYRFLK